MIFIAGTKLCRDEISLLNPKPQVHRHMIRDLPGFCKISERLVKRNDTAPRMMYPGAVIKEIIKLRSQAVIFNAGPRQHSASVEGGYCLRQSGSIKSKSFST